MPREEIAKLAAADISISDTETTGLDRSRNGLTEVASIRGVMEDGQPRLKLFHRYVLPLRPEYRDYLAACEKAKREKLPPPPYDRRRYEYEIEPAALKVTGTEIVRDQLDGPITGLKIKGVPVDAAPFYEVMPGFREFTRAGKNDVYYNAPFDMPFLGKLQEDILAHDAACENKHQTLPPGVVRALPKAARRVYEQLAATDYRAADLPTQARIRTLVRPLVDAGEVYRHPAAWQCVFHGYLLDAGFAQTSNLDQAYRGKVNAAFAGRQEHAGVEDVIMAARVALRIQHEQKTPTMAELYQQLLQRFDPAATVETLPARNGSDVTGDIRLHFSDDPRKLGEKAQRFWNMLEDFNKVPLRNSRAPRHVLQIDKNAHSVDINAERKQPLSVNFLKKCIFFAQLAEGGTIATISPYDSTGTRMDVVLHAKGPDGKPRVIEDVNYGSLRANYTYFNAHPEKAADLLQLIAALRKVDRRVGMVLFKERADGTIDITVKGHLRAFGTCGFRLEAGQNIAEAIPHLQDELRTQLTLGAIPHVAGFSPQDELEEDESIEAEWQVDEAPEANVKDVPKASMTRAEGGAMELTVTDQVFAAMAMRLGKQPEQILHEGFETRHGPITITRLRRTTGDPATRYRLTASRESFQDFIELGSKGEPGVLGEKPANIVRDASWLLYRLERLPGTYGIRIDGNMAILDQRDGVSLEALQILTKLGVPHKALPECIKVDVQQLMKNAFHYSKELGRAQSASTADRRAAEALGEGPFNSALADIHRELWRNNLRALETNEQRRHWILPKRQPRGKASEAHEVDTSDSHAAMAFDKGALKVEQSDLVGPHRYQLSTTPDGMLVAQATKSPVLLRLAQRFAKQEPQPGERWYIEHLSEADARAALDKASLFLYELGKQTGSQRLSVTQFSLSPDAKRVSLSLPSLSFLDNHYMLYDMQKLHYALADDAPDKAIRQLQRTLPDPSTVDMRRDDLVALSEQVRAQAGTVGRLSSAIRQYQTMLSDDDNLSYDATQELSHELATLGLLLHELSSSGSTLKHYAGDGHEAVHRAQELLGNAVFGGMQLKEDLGVANKALLGDSAGRGGLLREAGKSMASMIDVYAQYMADYDPRTPMRQHLAAFTAQVEVLLGDSGGEALQSYARRAAFRLLREDALEGRRTRKDLLDGLLAMAYPSASDLQREAIIRLYHEPGNHAAQQGISALFPAKARGNALTAPRLLKQYALLIEPPNATNDPDQWLEAHPEAFDAIEKSIRNAYASRAQYYLQRGHLRASYDPVDRDRLFALARHCYAQAGWDEAKIERTMARNRDYQFDAEKKDSIKQRVEMEVPEGSTRADDYLQTIDYPGHEGQVWDLMVAAKMRKDQREDVQLSEDILDQYYIFKQRKSLMNAVGKTLKETSDLLKVKRHHVRDLQGLLVMLQQDPAMAAQLSAEAESQIAEVGHKIGPSPEVAVGLSGDTISTVRGLIATQATQLRNHVLQHLAAQGVSPTWLPDGRIEIPTQALDQMFDAWCKKKEKPKKDIPEHLYRWVDRASGTLLRHHAVRSIHIDKQFAGLACSIDLPGDNAERAALWKQMQATATTLGISLPKDVPQAGQQEVRLPFSRAVLRGEKPFEKDGATLPQFRAAIRDFARAEGMDAGHVHRLGRRPVSSAGDAVAAVREAYGEEGVNAISKVLEEQARLGGIDPETIRKQLAQPPSKQRAS